MLLKYSAFLSLLLFLASSFCHAQPWNKINDGIFSLSWQDPGGDSIKFILSTQTNSSENVWSAFALSHDKYMV